MNFGKALEAAKQGARIARAGWNGKRMFVFLEKGSSVWDAQNGEFLHQLEDKIEGVSTSLYNRGADGSATRLPHLNMYSATGATVIGWLASQTDMLAEDWQILE
ncbi:hypothetical protein GCM10028806_34370 [Spirosoma terrae]|uniref:DUF2829 domain-containing protein n=1 Tax=Spirosoma terrae TaxID=1968276 RepID=A0A6L9L5S0_9BACT|nr:DUF2829 domain-containing protein [Spirosoma terrae]NDU95750.1 DUF2829 domain-containing protein [Spirosoma terrae]